MAMFPHERSLVKKMEGKPFALIGVNSDKDEKDEDKEAIQKQLKEHQVTWRSFKNKQKDKSISEEFGVQGWPTLLLIDHKGIVRKKWLGAPGNEKLDESIEKLVEEAVKDLGK